MGQYATVVIGKAQAPWCLGLCTMVGLLAGCALEPAAPVGPSERVRRPDRAAVILLADHMDPEVTGRLLAEGRLPNIKANLFDRGVAVDTAVTTVPSVTFAANVSIVTGRCPGHHDITGNQWFDRYQVRLADYNDTVRYLAVNSDFAAPTLFEMTPELYSAVILLPANRGATRKIENWMTAGLTWFFGTPAMLDSLTADRMALIGAEAERVGQWPDIILAYFWAPDIVAHRHGKHSSQYEAILVNLDRQVGRICDALRRAGMFDRSLLVLLSDHGSAATDPKLRVDIHQALRRIGFKVAVGPTPGATVAERVGWHRSDRIVVHADGDRRAAIHLRVGDDWRDRPNLQQIERFHRDYGSAAVRDNPAPFWKVVLEQLAPARQLVAVRADDGTVLVCDGVGTGLVERRVGSAPAGQGRSYRYRLVEPPDPLGLVGPPRPTGPAPPTTQPDLADGQFHSGAEWLSAAKRHRFPDFVPQIVEYFDSVRSGELTVFAGPGRGFAAGNRGGHGGLSRSEMLVPMVFAGPGLPAGGRIDSARVVDLVPTVLDFLGRAESARRFGPLDGVSRLDELRSAGRPATSPHGD